MRTTKISKRSSWICIDDAVIADADAPQVFFAGQLLDARRTWGIAQIGCGRGNPRPNLLGQPHKLAERAGKKRDLITHRLAR